VLRCRCAVGCTLHPARTTQYAVRSPRVCVCVCLYASMRHNPTNANSPRLSLLAPSSLNVATALSKIQPDLPSPISSGRVARCQILKILAEKSPKFGRKNSFGIALYFEHTRYTGVECTQSQHNLPLFCETLLRTLNRRFIPQTLHTLRQSLCLPAMKSGLFDSTIFTATVAATLASITLLSS
jgi:hypothetical protein